MANDLEFDGNAFAVGHDAIHRDDASRKVACTSVPHTQVAFSGEENSDLK